jgi:hypothetical protein
MHPNGAVGAYPILPFGGGFATAGLMGFIGLLVANLLDSNSYTRRLTPLFQPAMERLQRTYQRQPPHHQPHQPHQPQHQTQIQPTQPLTFPFDDEVIHYDDPQVHPNLCPTLGVCPLSGGIVSLHLPPNTPYAVLFMGLSILLLTLSLHCSRVRNRRDINFLLQLQHQIQTHTTTIPHAARYCQTSEQAVKDWMASFDTFALGPAGGGPEH